MKFQFSISRVFFLGLTVSFLNSQALAEKLVVISDIDDTLKISHVLDNWDVAANSFKQDNHFLGTSQIFNELAKENEVQFFYVSNATRFLVQSRHHEFLQLNGFPNGPVFLKDGLLDLDHKIVSMQKILNKTQPEKVILLGDNGQQDIEYYDRIAKMYPHIKFYTWIRVVYFSKANNERGKSLKPQQKGFATSIDLAAEWTKQNWISSSVFTKFLSDYTPATLSTDPKAESGEIMFPKWMACQDIANSPVTDLDPVLSADQNWKDYGNYRHARCSAAIR